MNVTGTESIVDGCEYPEIARVRAARLVASVFGAEATYYWASRAEQLLAALLTVSAIAGCEPGSIAAVVLDAPGDSVAHSVRATALHVLLNTRGVARPADPATPATPARPPEVGGGLAADRDPWVRQAVAENPSAPSEALVWLAGDRCAHVRLSVAQRLHAPSEALAKLADDELARVRNAVALNPSTPSEVLAKLADDALARVRDNAAKNPNAPSYVRARPGK